MILQRFLMSLPDGFKMLNEQGWFVGRRPNISHAELESCEPVEVRVADSPFSVTFPLSYAWGIGLQPEITKIQGQPLFLVYHEPIVHEGRRFILGFDREIFDKNFPLGRADLWDLDSLFQFNFSSWKRLKWIGRR